MRFIPFSDTVVNDPRLSSRVKEIIDSAISQNLAGEALWSTLVYSGVALGVESSQGFILEFMRNSAEAYRSTVDELGKLIMLQSDADSIEKLTSMKDVIQQGLKARVDHAIAMQASESSKLFGIPEDVILSDKDVREYPAADLQKMGHRASEQQRLYFLGWMHLRRKGLLEGMQCRCHVCVQRTLPKDTRIDLFEEIGLLIDEFGGDVGATFEEFAVSVIEDQRKTVQAVIDMRNPHDKPDGASADEITRNVMQSLRLTGKPGEATS